MQRVFDALFNADQEQLERCKIIVSNEQIRVLPLVPNRNGAHEADRRKGGLHHGEDHLPEAAELTRSIDQRSLGQRIRNVALDVAPDDNDIHGADAGRQDQDPDRVLHFINA